MTALSPDAETYASPPRPVRPRHAASLLLVRHDGDGPEVLMGKRPTRSRFAPDVYVFPGGRVDAADYAVRPSRPLAPACAARTGASPRLAQALAAAALRETWEETGLSLGDHTAPDFSSLTLAARAITPTNSPIRFHARFFLADAANASGDMASTHELSDLAYVPIVRALAELPLMDVTEAVLRGVAADEPPFLFTYRGGRPWRRLLA